MQKITIIIGLPGSGKTTYIKNHFIGLKGIVICDDYHKSTPNLSHDFKDSLYYRDLKKALANGEDAVLSDIAWCKAERRKLLLDNIKDILEELKINADVDFIYFDNNPTACKNNILKRKRKDRVEKEIEFLEKVSEIYQIPKEAKTIPVVS